MAFSREFNHDPNNGDLLRRPSDGLPPVVCKTGFFISHIIDWMGNLNNTNLHFVAIHTIRRQIDQQRIFIMASYNREGVFLDVLEGDLPCPNNCVPPEDSILPPDNTFSREHLMMVREYDDIDILNVHSALRFGDNLTQETHSIYPVVGVDDNADERTGPDDPVFTSIQFKAI